AHAAGLHALDELGDPEVLGVHAVDRRQGAAEHVVEAAVLARALDRDHVGRLLDHADEGSVAARVLADPAARPLGEVEADLAEPDPLLDLADRLGERERLLAGRPQDVEGEPLRRALPDPGQLRELAHEPLDRRGVHGPEATARRGGRPAAAAIIPPMADAVPAAFATQPYPTYREAADAFAAHVNRGKARALEALGVEIVIGEREGARFRDAYSGRWYWNCHCNGGVFNLGHRHPRPLAALREALEHLDVGNHHLVSGWRARLGEQLAAST